MSEGLAKGPMTSPQRPGLTPCPSYRVAMYGIDMPSLMRDHI